MKLPLSRKTFTAVGWNADVVRGGVSSKRQVGRNHVCAFRHRNPPRDRHKQSLASAQAALGHSRNDQPHQPLRSTDVEDGESNQSRVCSKIRRLAFRLPSFSLRKRVAAVQLTAFPHFFTPLVHICIFCLSDFLPDCFDTVFTWLFFFCRSPTVVSISRPWNLLSSVSCWNLLIDFR